MRDHLTAIRANALSIVAMCDRALAVTVPEGECPHPAELRMAAAAMGRPEAWRCACGAEGDE